MLCLLNLKEKEKLELVNKTVSFISCYWAAGILSIFRVFKSCSRETQLWFCGFLLESQQQQYYKNLIRRLEIFFVIVAAAADNPPALFNSSGLGRNANSFSCEKSTCHGTLDPVRIFRSGIFMLLPLLVFFVIFLRRAVHSSRK